MQTDITAAGRTIPAEKITIDSLPPIARVELQDWFQAITAGPRGGVGDGIGAIWLFCLFTNVLSPNRRLSYRSVEFGAFSDAELGEMIGAGAEIMGRLFPAEDGESKNAEATGKKTRSSKQETTGGEPA